MIATELLDDIIFNVDKRFTIPGHIPGASFVDHRWTSSFMSSTVRWFAIKLRYNVSIRAAAPTVDDRIVHRFKNLCYACNFALNCAANGTILRRLLKNIWVYPAVDNAGELELHLRLGSNSSATRTSSTTATI